MSVPTFQNIAKQNIRRMKTLFATGETMGLVERIIDDAYLVLPIFQLKNSFSLFPLSKIMVKTLHLLLILGSLKSLSEFCQQVSQTEL